MGRAPFNVLIAPYKVVNENIFFCIFKRKDMKIWQFIAGGGEGKEEPIETAKRETFEESKILPQNLFALKSVCSVPVTNFSLKAQKEWGKAVLVIPVYTFAALCNEDTEISLSGEHLEYKWCSYEEANRLLHFDIDKTMLFELNKGVKRGFYPKK